MLKRLTESAIWRAVSDISTLVWLIGLGFTVVVGVVSHMHGRSAEIIMVLGAAAFACVVVAANATIHLYHRLFTHSSVPSKPDEIKVAAKPELELSGFKIRTYNSK